MSRGHPPGRRPRQKSRVSARASQAFLYRSQEAARVGARSRADAHVSLSREIPPLTHQDALAFKGENQLVRPGAKIREHEISGARKNPRAKPHESFLKKRAALEGLPRVPPKEPRVADNRFRSHQSGRV